MGQQGAVSEYMYGSRVINEERLRVAFDEDIHYLNVDKSILLMLMAKAGKEKVGQMKHIWQTQERKSDFIATTAVGGSWSSGAAATGTLTVSSANAWLFAEGDTFMIPETSASQVFYIDSCNQSSGLITARTVDGTTINLSGASGDYLFLISNSFEQGSGRGTIKSEQPTEVYNYVQIIQTPIGITTTAKNIDYKGIDELDKQKFEAGVDHAFKIEKNLFYGLRHIEQAGFMNSIYDQTFMGGASQYISTNLTNVGGALSQSDFSDWMIDWTKYAESPFCFLGETVFEGLTDWAETSVRTTRNEDTFGIAISKYVTKYGKTVAMVPHRELLTSKLAGEAFGLDLTDIKYVHLNNLDTYMAVDVQDNAAKLHIDEWRTWASFKMINEKRHGRLYGVTSISLT